MKQIWAEIHMRYRSYIEILAGMLLCVVMGSFLTILHVRAQAPPPPLLAAARDDQAVINERLLNRDALIDTHIEETRRDLAEMKASYVALELRVRENEKQLTTLTAISSGGGGLLGLMQIAIIFFRQRDVRRDRRRADAREP